MLGERQTTPNATTLMRYADRQVTVEAHGGLEQRNFATPKGDRQLFALRSLKRFIRMSDMRVVSAVSCTVLKSIQQLLRWLDGGNRVGGAAAAASVDEPSSGVAGHQRARPPKPKSTLSKLRKWVAGSKFVRHGCCAHGCEPRRVTTSATQVQVQDTTAFRHKNHPTCATRANWQRWGGYQSRTVAGGDVRGGLASQQRDQPPRATAAWS